MPQYLISPVDDLALHIKRQLLSYLLTEWGRKFSGDGQSTGSTHQDHIVQVILVEQDRVLSYAEVSRRPVIHDGEAYNVYGLSGVWTAPAVRRRGYGQQVVAESTRYILASDADLGMLFCRPALIRFYAASGWRLVDGMQVVYGVKDIPSRHTDEIVLCLFVSEKGRHAQARFENRFVYVGRRTW